MTVGQITAVSAVLLLVGVAAVAWIATRPAAPVLAVPVRPPPPDFKFIRVRPGTFMMSDPGDATDPQHPVTITKPFDMAAYPVTVDQFNAFAVETKYRTRAEIMGVAYVQQPKLGEMFQAARGVTWRTMATGQPGSCPVTCVSWTDAVAYCTWASRVAGRRVRLPTEAEWEYACRAGTTGAFNVDGAAPTELGWFADNSGDHPFDSLATARRSAGAYYHRVLDEHCRPHPVGGKRANAWGLFDMHGNVWEFCADAVGPYSADPATDPTGPDDKNAKYRCGRGGGFCDPPYIGSSFNRGWWSPTVAYFHIGFRVAADVP